MEQMEIPHMESAMMQTAARQEALGMLLLQALDGAFANGMPVNVASIGFEGLDKDGNVAVSGVDANGAKFAFDVEIEGMDVEDGEGDAPVEGDPAAPPPDMAPAEGAAS
jgi:hypothetical protein